jgi:hypothetical protein
MRPRARAGDDPARVGLSEQALEPTTPMTDTTDVTSTLADLERKLRELEQELTSIGRHGAAPDSDSGPSGSPAFTQGTARQPSDSPAFMQGTAGRLVDEAIETPAAPAAEAARPAETSAPVRPPLQSQEPTRLSERPEPPPSVPPRQSQEPLQPTDEQLAGLAELRRFRDRLERFARELADEYDALLSRVMAGLFSVSPPPPPASPSVPVAPAPARSPMPPVASVPPPPPAAPAPPIEAHPEPQEEKLFEGHVELGVGPFYDIDSLSAFERRLAGIPNAIDASVRRFEASHAIIDLRLAAPVALVAELRRTMDTDFNVRQVADGRILLTFDEP